MFENVTSSLNSTDATNSSSSTVGIYAGKCASIAIFVLSTITFLVGIFSWIIIYKFRHFKNYLFLSIILNNILNIILSFVVEDVVKSKNEPLQYVHGISFLYFKLTAHFWLVVLCYVFYVDLVKVFNADLKRKYLKSSLFAWGVPVIIIVFNVCAVPYIDSSEKTAASIYIATLFFPLFINLMIYLRVLYNLLKIDVHDNSDRYRRVEVATIIFLISGTLFLLLPLRFLVTFPPYLSIVLVFLPPVVLDLYFFIIRLNRTVWKNYYNSKIKNSVAQARLKMSIKDRGKP